ncbi:MAG: DUF3035 domain-containing protein [Croceibacterium sp.]
MRNVTRFVLLALGATALAACGRGGDRARPDEFAVQRQAPLVVPPDFALVPPAPGAPRPTEGTSAEQALQALFGGQTQRSALEISTLRRAGQPDTSIRSTAGDPQTNTVDKGTTTRTIVTAPEGDGQAARASIPGK